MSNIIPFPPKVDFVLVWEGISPASGASTFVVDVYFVDRSQLTDSNHASLETAARRATKVAAGEVQVRLCMQPERETAR